MKHTVIYNESVLMKTFNKEGKNKNNGGEDFLKTDKKGNWSF